MPLPRVRENTGGLLHEIVHIYAPHDNRFLAEGLAVYLHATLAGNPAFPQLRRGPASFGCSGPVGGSVSHRIEQCADPSTVEQHHG